MENLNAYAVDGASAANAIELTFGKFALASRKQLIFRNCFDNRVFPPMRQGKLHFAHNRRQKGVL